MRRVNNSAALYWAIIIGTEARITGEHLQNLEAIREGMSDKDTGRTDGLKWVEEETFAHPWAGHNMNRCAGCGIAFVGDKRAVNCLACAWKMFTERGLTLSTISDMLGGGLDGMELVKAVGAVTGEREGLRSVVERLQGETAIAARWRANWKAIAKWHRQQWKALCVEVQLADSNPPTDEELARFIEQGKRYGQMTIGEIYDRLDAGTAATCTCGDSCSDEGAACWNCASRIRNENADLSQRVDSLCLDVTRLATRAREAEDERDNLQQQVAAMGNSFHEGFRFAIRIQKAEARGLKTLKEVERLIVERDAARADAAAAREALSKYADSDNWLTIRDEFEHDQIHWLGDDGYHSAAVAALASPNPGAPLLTELAQLRAIASLAAAFCAETIGEEITENGRLLNEAVKTWKEIWKEMTK